MMESMLSSAYSMKDPVAFRFVLGIQVERDRPRSMILLNQSSYILSILTRFDMIDSNSVKKPPDPSHQCVTSSTLVHHYPYRQAIGALMYLMTFTRPDLAYAVSKISRSSQKPTESDIVAIKRVFRYLKGQSRCVLDWEEVTLSCWLTLTLMSCLIYLIDAQFLATLCSLVMVPLHVAVAIKNA